MQALSLDQVRAARAKLRSVGAWPSNRSGGSPGVLSVPQQARPAPMRQLPPPAQAAIANALATAPRSVGQAEAPMPPGCCVFPGSMKYIAGSISLTTTASGTVSLDSPGMFCPQKIFVFGSVDINDIRITAIKAGIRNQIISGTIDARVFSIANTCCPVACLDCLCMPGVSLDISFVNDDAMTQTVTVVIVGCYVDACPPGGISMNAPAPIPVPGCPAPGSDKLVGFDSLTSVSASATASFSIETPGRFCPRQMLLFTGTSFTGVNVTKIQSGLDNQIISGSMPAELWSIDNDCCILSCFKCLCAPGVPLLIDIQNGGTAQRIRGMLVGTYSDAC
jgi:hypothetical protein